MSDEQPPYSQFYITAWTVLSTVIALVLFTMFILGDHLLHAGNIAWNLLRWLASPVI